MWHHTLPRNLGASSVPAVLLAVVLSAGLAHANLHPWPSKFSASGYPQSVSSSQTPAIVPATTVAPTAVASSSLEQQPPPPTSGSGNKNVFPGDWSMLLPTIAATFLGALLAFITAIWIARVGERRSASKQAQANKTRLRGLLDLIGRDLTWNRQELSAILVDLESHLTTDRKLTLDIWQRNGPEILGTNSAALADIAEAYGLLGRFSRILDQYSEDIRQGSTNSRNARTDTLPQLRALGNETTLALDSASNHVREETSSLT